MGGGPESQRMLNHSPSSWTSWRGRGASCSLWIVIWGLTLFFDQFSRQAEELGAPYSTWLYSEGHSSTAPLSAVFWGPARAKASVLWSRPWWYSSGGDWSASGDEVEQLSWWWEENNLLPHVKTDELIIDSRRKKQTPPSIRGDCVENWFCSGGSPDRRGSDLWAAEKGPAETISKSPEGE